MKIAKIVLLGKGIELLCPKCKTKRYIDDGHTVNECLFCRDKPFQVELIPINKYGLYEAVVTSNGNPVGNEAESEIKL